MTGYLIAAYAVFWVGIFIYVLSLAARQRRLAQKVDSLSAMVAESQNADGQGGSEAAG